MIERIIGSCSLFMLCVASAAAATAAAQTPPPVRPLGPIVKVSVDPLASVASVRALPDGRVFVNDITAHRVVLFDSALTKGIVVADSTSATANAYGALAGTLLAFRGDSTLFVDRASLSMLVIDAAGKITRVISVPRASDVLYLVGAIYGTPGFDALGRLVYRGRTPVAPVPPPGDSKPRVREGADSAPIVRVDLATRRLDTIALFKIPQQNVMTSRGENGMFHTMVINDPIPLVDDWTVLPDGSVAVVRGRDFHVDWMSADGAWTSTPRMPFDWRHLGDDEKATFLDSAKTALLAHYDSVTAARDNPPASGGRGSSPPAGEGSVAPRAARPAFLFIEPKDLPDYAPPFTQSATRADADGNLWIRTTIFAKGQPVYDIVNRRGELTDRVQLPPFRTIAGFGPGVVYMGVKDSAGVVHVERARIR